MKQRGTISYRAALFPAGLAVGLGLLFAFLPARFSILANIACFAGGSVPFVWVLENRKKIPAIWLLGPLSVLILIAGIEAGLHFGPLKHRFLPMGIGKNYKPDPLLFWKPKEIAPKHPDQVKEQSKDPIPFSIDVYGSEIKELLQSDGSLVRFRSGRTTLEKPPGSFRIVTMGGSNAWGLGIKYYQDTLSGQLESMLQNAFPGKKIEVIAAGVPGYCLFQNLIFYQFVIRKFQPDLVILYANINEAKGKAPYTLHEYFRENTGLDPTKPLDQNISVVKKQSMISLAHESLQKLNTYNLITEGIVKARDRALKGSKTILKDINPVEDYNKDLDNLIGLIKEDGAGIILVDAFFYKRIENEGFFFMMKKYQWAMEEKAKKWQVPFIAGHDILAGQENPNSFVSEFDKDHINEKGHLKVAEIIFETIQTNHLIGQE